MIWISAITLVVSICGGIAAYLIGIANALATLKSAGSADPSALAGDISTVMIGSMISLPFAFASMVLFIIAIVRHRKFSNPNLAG